MSVSPSRRTFLRHSSAIAVGGLLAGGANSLSAASYGRVVGANEKLRGAVIGFNGQGKSHIGAIKDHLVALCDCDSKVLSGAIDEFEKQHGRRVDGVEDFRTLVERPDIDFVTIATPNHTHALIAISAIVAGKDVYVEKPVSHNVYEGRQIVHAARQHGRVVQTGTQSRSSAALREAKQFVDEGGLGKLLYAVGTCYKPRKAIGKLSKPLQIPDHVNYDLWCGPAEKRELLRPKLHYDWHWDFNTGNGDMGNQGIHQMDIARWFVGESQISPRVLSIGGRLGYEDAGDTPNTQTVIHAYESAPIIFETRGLPQSKEHQDNRWGNSMDNYLGSQIGVIVFYEGGRLVIPNYHQAIAYDRDDQLIRDFNRGGNHFENFLQAVRVRDPKQLNAEILEGHLSSALCHTGAMSHQLGRAATSQEILDKVGGDD
ncbi:MAG: Gfo/Idh/MocA family oxidoreductase, partial [Pirellulaceae bacterium]|nr:Gfo/Idh/MocA family oxidoreductase [Pirellulaceae bacterium]